MHSSVSWPALLCAKLDRFHSHPAPPFNAPVLLDTSLKSDNAGDCIIMDACNRVFQELFPNDSNPIRIPTHCYTPELEHHKARMKLLCGTNIIYTNVRQQKQWALPKNLSNFRNVYLLGVGMSDIGIEAPIDRLSATFYKEIFGDRGLHSVRDELTRKKLASIGISNVLNTACPTMWSLTPEAQSQIPVKKARNVLTSITDYAFSPEHDKEMLSVLAKNYEKVSIWIQGTHDLDWCLEKIVPLEQYEIIGPGIDRLNEVLEREDLDYVGTRLHAGIRSLNYGHRSLIIAVDNRARQIGADTNLPVMERSGVFDGSLEHWINNPARCNIRLPQKNIDKWKSQFKQASS